MHSFRSHSFCQSIQTELLINPRVIPHRILNDSQNKIACLVPGVISFPSHDAGFVKTMKIKELCVYSVAALMRGLPRIALCLIMLTLCMLNLPDALYAQESDRVHSEKTMIAVRADTPPKIDGILDDEVWQRAPITTGFIQKDPDEGEPATEKTTVQIAYDDGAVYVGILAYDDEPKNIVARLYRRDELNEWEGDWVGIYFDPHHDHQTGNFFLVSPSGTLKDGIIYNDEEFDTTWDGVWEAKTSIHDKGWTAEFKIPYHVLRFSPKEEYTWGMNVGRRIGRKHERISWVMVPKNESGWVSRFGHLEGIKGIHPKKHLEFLPFALGRSTFEPDSLENKNGRELFSSVGLDLRYGLSTNFSLNATINPDFGQVEADPAVLNLSVFETFFGERRPFFVEGASIFRIKGCQPFYSRRIGKRPGHFDTPSSTKTIDLPDATTILGAAKLTGKTATKTSIGILSAVTAPEYATIEETVTEPATGLERTERKEHLIEPLTNYFVGRVVQDVLKGSSRVGFLTTAANRKDAESAYVGAMDWDLKFGKNAHQCTGTIGASRAGSEGKIGWLADFAYNKTSGWFRSNAGVSITSPGFNPNDLGYIGRVNKLSPRLRMKFKKEQPWGPFRRLSLDMNGGIAWNFRHEWAGQTERWVNLSKSMGLGFDYQLKNFWGGEVGVHHHFEGLDDLDTRGGALIVTPAATQVAGWIEGDSRLKIIPDFSFSLWADVEGSIGRGFRLALRIKPVSSVEFRIAPGYSWAFNKAQWVKNVDDDGDGRNDHFVYGELKSHTLNFTTRVNVIFTPDLSLQFYMRPFIAVGDYENFKELARPSSYEFTPYTNLDENPDFSYRSLRSNLVLRWEYRPGSTLFAVWSQSRSESFDDPSFHPWDSLKESFSDEGQNIFLIKLNYWLGI